MGLQKDGDLWERFWAASILRGPRTLRLTKVKAHCGQAEIEQGIITKENKIGNDFSDTAATRGTGEGMPGLLQLANWLSKNIVIIAIS